MWYAPSSPLAGTRPSGAVGDGRRLPAPLALIGSRTRAPGPRWTGLLRWSRHAVIAALALSPLVARWAWDIPLLAPLPAPEFRTVESGATGYALAGRPDRLPALGPLAEDESALVDRIVLYRVAPGDNLHALAQHFGISADTLLWANALPDPDRLLPGQELLVPPVSGVVHTVDEGDTVAALAERYGVSPLAVIGANGLPEPFALEVGARLLVPDGRPPRVTTPARAVAWPAPGTGVQFRQQFIEAAAVAAQETQRRYGVPASVAIAQAIHETGWGASRLAREGHNYFGIKGRNSEGPAGVVWMNTWEVFNGRNVIVREPFRAYHTPDESFFDYGLFFHQNRRYHAALAVAHDPRAFIQAISAAGFATDPVYAAKIIRMMDQYNLYQYDLR